MTLKRLILLLSAAVLTAAGCSMRPEYYEFTLEATADCEPATRTSYEGDKSFSWTAGDKISVIFNNGSSDKFFTLTAQGTGPTSVFKGSVTNGYILGAADGNQWALYPADEHTYEGGVISFCQRPDVDFTTSGFSANIPMAALGEGGSFVFKPMCSVVKFTFTGLAVSKVNFTVTATNTHALSGLFPCVNGGFLLSWYAKYAKEGSPDRTISFTENVSDGKAVFYVPIPGWDGAGFIPVITLTDAATGTVLYNRTAKQGLPSSATASLGRIVVLPEINLSDAPPSEATTLTYTGSDEIILNPERGFYKAVEYHSASDTPLKASKIASVRAEGRSLILLEYYLTDFMESDISSAYLSLIEKSLQNLRSGGVKCILRFAYKNGHADKDHPWDATETWVMRHIEQLKPLFTTYSDVIFVLQAGFIGSWGEWYYTDNFIMSPSSTSDYAPRKRVLEALLDAMPADRQVQVRTPKFKMKLVGSTPLSRSTAHNGSNAARVGAHNDCFVASGSDQGTFNNDSERSFWASDTRYTIMGGETCALSDQCHCDAYGGNPGTLSELSTYHWTYLHDGYKQEVLNRWKEEGCFDLIDKMLGYRLVMKDASFGAARAGENMSITLHLRNEGCAAPMNPRPAYLVLTRTSGSVLAQWELGSDPRFWGPDDGEITINKTIQLPAGISGEVKLHLYLPDASGTIASDPRFAIRFANDGMWDDATGYNTIYKFNL